MLLNGLVSLGKELETGRILDINILFLRMLASALHVVLFQISHNKYSALNTRSITFSR